MELIKLNISKFRVMRMPGLWVAFVTLLALTTACATWPGASSPTASGQTPEQVLEQNMTPTPEFDAVEIRPEGQVLPGSPKSIKQNECPDLESMLFQIAQAPDPLTLAQQLQLKVKEDKIQVVLILDSEDTSFLQNFEVEIGTQMGTQVQAFVPINQLCALANTAEVLAVRLPAQAVPQ